MSLQSGEVSCHGNRNITILFSPVRQCQKHTSPAENSVRKVSGGADIGRFVKPLAGVQSYFKAYNSPLRTDRKDVDPRGDFLTVQDLSLEGFFRSQSGLEDCSDCGDKLLLSWLVLPFPALVKINAAFMKSGASRDKCVRQIFWTAFYFQIFIIIIFKYAYAYMYTQQSMQSAKYS